MQETNSQRNIEKWSWTFATSCVLGVIAYLGNYTSLDIAKAGKTNDAQRSTM